MELCAECHAQIVDSYSQTAMARALGPIEPGELEGLDEPVDAFGGLRYALVGDAEGGSVVESRVGTEHRLEVPIEFGIGAGVRLRSLAARFGRTLRFAPLELHTLEGGRETVLAPPQVIRPGRRFYGKVTPECLGCHTDDLPPLRHPLHLAPEPETWQPRGIGCASCHGDRGAEHAAWQVERLALLEPEGGDPILDPAALDRHRQLSVCGACHLQGDVRIELEPGVLGAFPPGAELTARRAVFVAREPSDEIGFVSQLERLVLGACFQGSDSMVCTTCHDPHADLQRPEERARVRAACSGCHGDDSIEHPGTSCSRTDEARDRDCVDCHMRATPVFDVAGAIVHDHRIERRPPPPSHYRSLRFPESAEGDWRVFGWPDTEPPACADDPGLWTMAYDHSGHFERALALAEREPGLAAARLPMYHHVRGSVFERAGRPAEAERAYREALALDPTLAPTAINLALLLGAAGRGEEGEALLDEVLIREPASDGALSNRAVLRGQRGDFAGAREDAERAFEIAPRPELARLLSQLAGSDAEQAALWSRRAAELDPLR